MGELLSHRGLVTEKLADGTAVVDVNREHACTGCHEKSSCSMQSTNSIKVRFKNAHDLNTGDMVLITIKKTDFFRSMGLIYIAPLLIMLITAVGLDSIGTSQVVTAFSTIIAVGLYFLLLKLVHKGRDRQGYIKIPN